MRILLCYLALVLPAFGFEPDSVLTEKTITAPTFGEVHLYFPSPHPRRVAIFISGDGGWNLGVVEMARKLARQDTLVAGVDIIRYLKTMEAAGGSCSYPAADFEALSQSLQQTLGFSEYIAPVLVGYSSGATLVYATIVQSPATAFRGAISMGFCPDLPLSKPFCRGSGLQWEPGPKGKGFSFLPAPGLKIPWIVLHGGIDQVCDPGGTERFVAKIPSARLIRLPKVGHGFSVERNWMPQFSSSFMELADRAEAGIPPAPPSEEVKDLPLIVSEVSGGTKGNRLGVFLTGDGGWGVTDQGVCQGLAAQGIPTVALNSLKYFWKKRTPESAALDLQRILRHYLAFWKKEKVVLLGYSMGADVLSFMANRLPSELLDRIQLIVLLGPGVNVEFEFHFSNWFISGSGSKGLPVLPELERLRGKPILAFYGLEESDSLCKIMDPALARIVPLKGGHRIRGNYGPVLEEILKELK